MITLSPGQPGLDVANNVYGGPMAEHYHSLVHWLRSVGDMSGVTPKSVGVTSCTSGAGVSTVATNLAIAAAQAAKAPVLLLDLSTTRSHAARRFAIAGDLGLSEALDDIDHAHEYVKESPQARLSVLAANLPGSAQPMSVDSAKIDRLLRTLENEFSLVVVDLPAVESSMCFVAAGLVNGVLLVVEAERTRLEIAARAKQRLLDARASVLGVILNKDPQYLPNWLESRI